MNNNDIYTNLPSIMLSKTRLTFFPFSADVSKYRRSLLITKKKNQ